MEENSISESLIIKQQIKDLVVDFMRTNLYDIPKEFWGKNEFDHIINIGVSILSYKWELETHPGSFVKAVVDNDLMGAFAKADHINQKVLKIYCKMLYNIPRPNDIRS